MRSIRSLFVGFILLSIFLPGSLLAAQKPGNSRACTMSDLVGTWDMKGINAKVRLDPKDSFGWPYQRFVFTSRGEVKEMVSTTPIENDPAALKKFANALCTSRYGFDQQGFLNITKLELPYPEKCLCSYATQDIPGQVLLKIPESKRARMPAKGDIVLTYVSKTGEPVVAKTLKKVS